MDSRNHSEKAKGASGSDFSARSLLYGVLLGTGVGIACAAIFVIVGTAVAYSRADPSSIEKIAALIALYLSSALGAYASVKFSRQSCALCGVFFSALWLSFILIVAFALPANSVTDGEGPSFVWHTLVIVSSFIGAFLGGGRKGSGRRKKKNTSKRRKKSKSK